MQETDHVNGCDEAKDNIQDASDPDKLFRKNARQPDVAVAEYERDNQTEYEENNSVGAETEIIIRAVDSIAVESIGSRIALYTDTGDRYEASTNRDE